MFPICPLWFTWATPPMMTSWPLLAQSVSLSMNQAKMKIAYLNKEAV